MISIVQLYEAKREIPRQYYYHHDPGTYSNSGTIGWRNKRMKEAEKETGRYAGRYKRVADTMRGYAKHDISTPKTTKALRHGANRLMKRHRKLEKRQERTDEKKRLEADKKYEQDLRSYRKKKVEDWQRKIKRLKQDKKIRMRLDKPIPKQLGLFK